MSKQVKCKSGLMGWQGRLRSNYATFEVFEGYCQIFNLHNRLGYKSPKNAWQKNPVVQGSTNPSDFRRVKAAAKGK